MKIEENQKKVIEKNQIDSLKCLKRSLVIFLGE